MKTPGVAHRVTQDGNASHAGIAAGENWCSVNQTSRCQLCAQGQKTAVSLGKSCVLGKPSAALLPSFDRDTVRAAQEPAGVSRSCHTCKLGKVWHQGQSAYELMASRLIFQLLCVSSLLWAFATADTGDLLLLHTFTAASPQACKLQH